MDSPTSCKSSLRKDRFKDFKMTFYQCNFCKIIFETKSKALEHLNSKHKSQDEERKDNRKNDNPLEQSSQNTNELFNLDETTADLVKLGGRKKIKKEINFCKFCKKSLQSAEDYSQVLILDYKTFNKDFSCSVCFKKAIKSKPK